MSFLDRAFVVFWTFVDASIEALFYGALPIGILLLAFYGVLRFVFKMTSQKLAIALMFVSFGGFLGIFITTSRDPILSSILPLIITFVSGYVAYSFKKDDSVLNVDVVPVAVICLVFSATLGAFFGSELRQKAEVSTAKRQFDAEELKAQNAANREKAKSILEGVEIPLNRLAGCREKFGDVGDACKELLK